MSAEPLPAFGLVQEVANYDRPRQRTVLRLTPKPTVCEACLTDTEPGPCPANCPLRVADRPAQD